MLRCESVIHSTENVKTAFAEVRLSQCSSCQTESLGSCHRVGTTDKPSRSVGHFAVNEVRIDVVVIVAAAAVVVVTIFTEEDSRAPKYSTPNEPHTGRGHPRKFPSRLKCLGFRGVPHGNM